VGISTCNKISEAVIANNLNYREVFYQPLPAGVFSGKALNALNTVRALCAQLGTWTENDPLSSRSPDIIATLTVIFGAQAALNWQNAVAPLPTDTTLEEVRDFLWADTDEQINSLLEAIYERLELPPPVQPLLPPRVRIMTMHGAKGLSAHVVFVPGLEDDILPGPWRAPYPGLVLEAARLLYVSITRARASCVMSYASYRMVNGMNNAQTSSRFNVALGAAFVSRTSGLAAAEIQQIVQDRSQL
jgi:superfamily I DNA/RNA helicase